jgi:hypothetical protein
MEGNEENAANLLFHSSLFSLYRWRTVHRFHVTLESVAKSKKTKALMQELCWNCRKKIAVGLCTKRKKGEAPVF